MVLSIGWLRKSIGRHEAGCTSIADRKAETLRAQFIVYGKTKDGG
jgi:hypothetical protein